MLNVWILEDRFQLRPLRFVLPLLSTSETRIFSEVFVQQILWECPENCVTG